MQKNTNQEFLNFCENGDLEKVKECLESKKININLNNDEPLILASENGHLEIVKLLLKNGAKMNSRDYKALFSACDNCHYDVIYSLIYSLD